METKEGKSACLAVAAAKEDFRVWEDRVETSEGLEDKVPKATAPPPVNSPLPLRHNPLPPHGLLPLRRLLRQPHNLPLLPHRLPHPVFPRLLPSPLLPRHRVCRCHAAGTVKWISVSRVIHVRLRADRPPIPTAMRSAPLRVVGTDLPIVAAERNAITSDSSWMKPNRRSSPGTNPRSHDALQTARVAPDFACIAGVGP